ncbi:MAG: hypothetical protein JXA95_06475 [Spirochaetales bacterium]|nr:hypothetical protein [Spirochaetales bacterium]
MKKIFVSIFFLFSLNLFAVSPFAKTYLSAGISGGFLDRGYMDAPILNEMEFNAFLGPRIKFLLQHKGFVHGPSVEALFSLGEDFLTIPMEYHAGFAIFDSSYQMGNTLYMRDSATILGTVFGGVNYFVDQSGTLFETPFYYPYIGFGFGSISDYLDTGALFELGAEAVFEYIDGEFTKGIKMMFNYVYASSF